MQLPDMEFKQQAPVSAVEELATSLMPRYSLRRAVNQCGCAVEQWPECVYILEVVYSECSLCAARPAVT
jgi:hypothetical protein